MEDMIVALLAKQKRTIARDTKDDPQVDIALYTKYNLKRSTKDKGEMKLCYYSKKMSHMASNYNVPKVKLMDKPHVANIVVVEDPPHANNGDDDILCISRSPNFEYRKGSNVDIARCGWSCK
jgi:hypothetical protein